MNNQVHMMQNILLAGMQFLQDKCIETNKYGKKFLAAESTVKLGKSWAFFKLKQNKLSREIGTKFV